MRLKKRDARCGFSSHREACGLSRSASQDSGKDGDIIDGIDGGRPHACTFYIRSTTASSTSSCAYEYR